MKLGVTDSDSFTNRKCIGKKTHIEDDRTSLSCWYYVKFLSLEGLLIVCLRGFSVQYKKDKLNPVSIVIKRFCQGALFHL